MIISSAQGLGSPSTAQARTVVPSTTAWIVGGAGAGTGAAAGRGMGSEQERRRERITEVCSLWGPLSYLIG